MMVTEETMNSISQTIVMFITQATKVRSSVYLDTNAWSSLAKGYKPIDSLKNWLKTNPYCFVLLSRFQVGELTKDTRLAEGVSNLASELPLIFVDRGTNEMQGDPWYHVKHEKVMPISLPTASAKDAFSNFLKDRGIWTTMGNLNADKKAWQDMISDALSRVPPKRKRSWREFPRFLESWIRNRYDHNGMSFQPESIKDPNRYIGLKLCAGVMFLRYYINRKGFEESDYLDFLHASDMPYSRIVVTERNLCECIRQTSRHLPGNGPDYVFTLDWLNNCAH